MVARLLKAGLPASGRLQEAARLGELPVLRLLADASGNASSDAGLALREAAQAGHAKVVRWLTGELLAPVDEADFDTGATALHLAVLAGHLAAARALLEAGADSAVRDKDLLSPMHYAATTHGRVRLSRQKELMETLVRHGGHGLWNAFANEGLTPLHLAAAANDAGLARWLVLERRVADPGIAAAGVTPAGAAAQANHTALAASLHAWAAQTWGEL